MGIDAAASGGRNKPKVGLGPFCSLSNSLGIPAAEGDLLVAFVLDSARLVRTSGESLNTEGRLCGVPGGR
jgi:hypothetical protein